MGGGVKIKFVFNNLIKWGGQFCFIKIKLFLNFSETFINDYCF
jgi:hypothetical protein